MPSCSPGGQSKGRDRLSPAPPLQRRLVVLAENLRGLDREERITVCGTCRHQLADDFALSHVAEVSLCPVNLLFDVGLIASVG